MLKPGRGMPREAREASDLDKLLERNARLLTRLRHMAMQFHQLSGHEEQSWSQCRNITCIETWELIEMKSSERRVRL